MDAQDAPREIGIEDSIDLHAFAPAETRAIVEEYVALAARRFDEVRVVHGRGRGTRRSIVRATLARSPHVISFRDATPDRGGWGATIAVLARDAAGGRS